MIVAKPCKIRPGRSLLQNCPWHRDTWPKLSDLEPHGHIELGRFAGPGVVRHGGKLKFRVMSEGGRDQRLVLRTLVSTWQTVGLCCAALVTS
jgi:hypothetical protein